MEEVVIADYLRSAFSRSRPTQPEKDVFDKLCMSDVVAMLVKEIIKRNKIKPEEINDMITGCSLQMAENWLMGGRVVPLLAELPVTVPAQGTDRVCCSAMSAIHQGSMEITLGYSDIVLACGMEHMTHIPLQADLNPHLGFSATLMEEKYVEKYDMTTTISMGLTAEKLFAECKDELGLTREDLDKWAVRSHQLAAKASDEGFFKGEILPIEVTLADGSKKVIDADQSIRRDTSLEAVSSLKPAFKADGVITAGNSSPLNAGGSAMLLMSRKKAKEYGIEPKAKIISMGWAGVDPSVMGKGPVPASQMALKKAGLEVKDIDFWEINEAFTVVTLYAIKKLGIDPDRVNVKGGATAIGHPLGASGVRLTGTLARILDLEGARYGCATMCGGGGQGTATVIEHL